MAYVVQIGVIPPLLRVKCLSDEGRSAGSCGAAQSPRRGTQPRVTTPIRCWALARQSPNLCGHRPPSLPYEFATDGRFQYAQNNVILSFHAIQRASGESGPASEKWCEPLIEHPVEHCLQADSPGGPRNDTRIDCHEPLVPVLATTPANLRSRSSHAAHRRGTIGA